MPDNSPQRDLKDKLNFERQLLPIIQDYNERIVGEFTFLYASSGAILTMSGFNAELSDILNDYYHGVTDTFSNRVTPHLPTEVAITDDESSRISELLLAWALFSTAQNAQRINATTQDNILDSVRLAQSDEITRSLTGLEAQRTVAAIAGRHLERDLKGRESALIMTETQVPAERAKQVEIDVLTRTPPAIIGGTPLPITGELDKEWVSVADNLVRPAHLAADGQKVPLSQPFIVGGQALMIPGDATLGASAGNVINCRCSSKVETSDIISFRFSRNV